MNKLIMTEWDHKILTALVNDGKTVQLQIDSPINTSILNNIYIGKVKNILSNINSAFIEIGNEQMGYYSLTENKTHLYVKPHTGTALKVGDELVVQVAKDAVKTKAPVLSSHLNFTGKYCVLTVGNNSIGFSNKIYDTQWKNEWKLKLEKIQTGGFGIIIRTNAKNAAAEQILNEIDLLKQEYQKIMTDATYRTCYSMLFQALPPYVSSIRDSYAESLEEIITDDKTIYAAMKQYMESKQEEDIHKLIFYQDSLLPLKKLYSLESALESASVKKVWLKSGGYLIIEPTEALVVIDVNTGKYSGKKNMRDTILKVNFEAADEVAKQLRLRNLTGIIIIDFIDMENSEDQMILLKRLDEAVSKDPVKTNVVGMTKLNLVEVTRKKIRKPLYEQIRVNQASVDFS